MDNLSLYLYLGILFAAIIGLSIYGRAWRNPQGFESGTSADRFQNTKPSERPKPTIPVQADSNLNQVADPPFVTAPINSVDDYEYNLVFQNEGDRGITKAQKDSLMRAYPMDWTVQPPSSSAFQKGLADYKESFQSGQHPQPQAVNPYKGIDGENMTPPDTLSEEKKEREILATYVPKKPQELTTYDASDAKELIHRIYDAKGLVADYQEVKPGVFAVTGTRRKDEKVVYEDEVAPASEAAVPQAGENTLVVPPAAMEYNSGLDPFFTPGEKTRDGKWNYTQWTPGLERMFAPTEPRTNWY
jgi:hypothetical protein